jgi:hypothetical protein
VLCDCLESYGDPSPSCSSNPSRLTSFAYYIYPLSYYYSVPGGSDPCLEDIAPPDMPCEELVLQWTPACQEDNAIFTDYSCGCMSEGVQNATYCQRSCAMCSPRFVSMEGFSSGSLEEMEPISNLAYGISKYQNPLSRVKREPYDVAAVAEAVRVMNNGAQPLDIPPTVRVAFYDACDCKYIVTSGKRKIMFVF